MFSTEPSLLDRAINRYPVLPQSQVRTLIAAAQQHFYPLRDRFKAEDLNPEERRNFMCGKRANDKLVEHNLRLVTKQASYFTRRFQGKIPDRDLFDVLFQEGILGLHTGIEKFNLDAGTQFSTYVIWWVRQSIRRWLQTHQTAIRLPIHVLEFKNKMYKARTALKVELNRNPTHQELADRLEVPLEKVQRTLELTTQSRVLSLNYQPHGEGEAEILDLFTASSENPQLWVEEVEFTEKLNSILAELPEQERQILTLLYGLNDSDPPQSAIKVAAKLNLPPYTVSRSKANAFKALQFELQRWGEEATPSYRSKEDWRRVWSYVNRYPGRSVKQIQTGAGLSYETTLNNLRRMTKSGQVAERIENGVSYFSVAAFSLPEKSSANEKYDRLLALLQDGPLLLREIAEVTPGVLSQTILEWLCKLRDQGQVCVEEVSIANTPPPVYFYYLAGTTPDLEAIAAQKSQEIAELKALTSEQRILQVLTYHPQRRGEILAKLKEMGTPMSRSHLNGVLGQLEDEGRIVRRDLAEPGRPSVLRLPLDLKPGLFVVEHKDQPSQRFGWVESVNANGSVVCRWINGTASLTSDSLLDLIPVSDIVTARRLELAKQRHEGGLVDDYVRLDYWDLDGLIKGKGKMRRIDAVKLLSIGQKVGVIPASKGYLSDKDRHQTMDWLDRYYPDWREGGSAVLRAN